MVDDTVETIRLDIGNGLRGGHARAVSARPHPAVPIFTEAYGRNTHFEPLVRRPATAGDCALVPDPYRGDVYDYSDIDSARARLRLLGDAAVMVDTGRAPDFLAARKEVDPAGHGLFCDARPGYRPAPAAEAWIRLLGFLSRSLNTSQ